LEKFQALPLIYAFEIEKIPFSLLCMLIGCGTSKNSEVLPYIWVVRLFLHKGYGT